MPMERILARQDRLHSPSLARVDFYLLFASEGRALFLRLSMVRSLTMGQ